MKRSSWGRDGAEEVDKSSFSRFLAELGRGSLARTDGGVAEEGGGMSHLFGAAVLAPYCEPWKAALPICEPCIAEEAP